jgi:alpha-L-fucosidase
VTAAVRAAAVLGVLAAATLRAQDAYRPTPENLAARAAFQDAKLGLFIHWGIYSTLGAGEWVMHNRQMRVAEYERLADFFNPIAYDPAQWVAIAKAAGMRYITITTRHHDGFALFDSRASDYDIVRRTPYGRDVIGMLVAAARRDSLPVFFYYSQLDWHHPDYYPRGFTGQHAGRPDSGTFARYVDFMQAQLRELLTSYGPVGGIWFDGWWDRPEHDWRLAETYRLIHTLQPAALIIPNHHQAPLPGEDVQTFEKDLPGGNTAGWNTSTISDLPLETSETINGSWGFNITDRGFKSVRDLVRLLVNAAGRNANLLLNVGPMPDGRIQPEFVERLQGLGAWLAVHGDAIYGTRGGPVAPRPWGVTTQQGDRVFVHLLQWPETDDLWLPLERPVRRARFVGRDGAVAVRRSGRGVLLQGLPALRTDEPVLVVELELGR